MHADELWQEFDASGEPLMSGGYPAELDNPKKGSGRIVGVSKVWFFRRTVAGVELLWQKRSDKVENGGAWDISAGGHINYQETPLAAAVRESKEEIGAEITEKDLLFGFVTNKFGRIFWQYFCDITDKSQNFHFNDAEVSEVKFVALQQTNNFRKNFAKSGLSTDDTYFDLLENWLDNYLELNP